MTLYGTEEQCKESPGFYKHLPKEYPYELMKEIIKNQNEKLSEKNKYGLSLN